MTDTYYLRRDEIAALFPGNYRAQNRFDEMQRTVADTGTIVTANLGATDGLANATYVTLSANSTLPNEYVLGVGNGLGLSVADGSVTITLGSTVVRSPGGQSIAFTSEGDATLAVPLAGYLATRAGVETFTNKTLTAPKIDGIGDYADDTAAAAGGVPVGGIYRTGSALKVRVS